MEKPIRRQCAGNVSLTMVTAVFSRVERIKRLEAGVSTAGTGDPYASYDGFRRRYADDAARVYEDLIIAVQAIMGFTQGESIPSGE